MGCSGKQCAVYTTIDSEGYAIEVINEASSNIIKSAKFSDSELVECVLTNMYDGKPLGFQARLNIIKEKYSKIIEMCHPGAIGQIEKIIGSNTSHSIINGQFRILEATICSRYFFTDREERLKRGQEVHKELLSPSLN
jgi:hypothetical protein